MFSAVKLVAAGVVVALFGGFLLTGFLVTPQREEAVPAAVTSSPTPEATSELMPTTVRTDILPGVPLTVEALEAGVLRVVSDGQRDLLSENNRGVVAGQDGSIWLLRKNRFVRLGDAQGHQWHEDDREERYGHPEFVVAPDGTVWAAIWSARGEKTTLVLGSYDGEGWRVHEAPSESRSRTP